MADLDYSRLSLQEWTRVRSFLRDLCDPEGFGFSVTEEVTRRARELLALFDA